jgi:hypothetical protein
VCELGCDGLCADPRGALERVRALLEGKGHAPSLRDLGVTSFEPRRRDPLEEELGVRVDEALEEFLASPTVAG